MKSLALSPFMSCSPKSGSLMKRSGPYWPRHWAKPRYQLRKSPHHMEEDAIAAVVEEEVEVKVEDAICHLMKTKRRNHLISWRFNAIIARNTSILHTNVEVQKRREMISLCDWMHSDSDGGDLFYFSGGDIFSPHGNRRSSKWIPTTRLRDWSSKLWSVVPRHGCHKSHD